MIVYNIGVALEQPKMSDDTEKRDFWSEKRYFWGQRLQAIVIVFVFVSRSVKGGTRFFWEGILNVGTRFGVSLIGTACYTTCSNLVCDFHKSSHGFG